MVFQSYVRLCVSCFRLVQLSRWQYEVNCQQANHSWQAFKRLGMDGKFELKSKPWQGRTTSFIWWSEPKWEKANEKKLLFEKCNVALQVISKPYEKPSNSISLPLILLILLDVWSKHPYSTHQSVEPSHWSLFHVHFGIPADRVS